MAFFFKNHNQKFLGLINTRIEEIGQSGQGFRYREEINELRILKKIVSILHYKGFVNKNGKNVSHTFTIPKNLTLNEVVEELTYSVSGIKALEDATVFEKLKHILSDLRKERLKKRVKAYCLEQLIKKRARNIILNKLNNDLGFEITDDELKKLLIDFEGSYVSTPPGKSILILVANSEKNYNLFADFVERYFISEEALESGQSHGQDDASLASSSSGRRDGEGSDSDTSSSETEVQGQGKSSQSTKKPDPEGVKFDEGNDMSVRKEEESSTSNRVQFDPMPGVAYGGNDVEGLNSSSRGNDDISVSSSTKEEESSTSNRVQFDPMPGVAYGGNDVEDLNSSSRGNDDVSVVHSYRAEIPDWLRDLFETSDANYQGHEDVLKKHICALAERLDSEKPFEVRNGDLESAIAFLSKARNSKFESDNGEIYKGSDLIREEIQTFREENCILGIKFLISEYLNVFVKNQTDKEDQLISDAKSTLEWLGIFLPENATLKDYIGKLYDRLPHFIENEPTIVEFIIACSIHLDANRKQDSPEFTLATRLLNNQQIGYRNSGNEGNYFEQRGNDIRSILEEQGVVISYLRHKLGADKNVVSSNLNTHYQAVVLQKEGNQYRLVVMDSLGGMKYESDPFQERELGEVIANVALYSHNPNRSDSAQEYQKHWIKKLLPKGVSFTTTNNKNLNQKGTQCGHQAALNAFNFCKKAIEKAYDIEERSVPKEQNKGNRSSTNTEVSSDQSVPYQSVVVDSLDLAVHRRHYHQDDGLRPAGDEKVSVLSDTFQSKVATESISQETAVTHDGSPPTTLQEVYDSASQSKSAYERLMVVLGIDPTSEDFKKIKGLFKQAIGVEKPKFWNRNDEAWDLVKNKAAKSFFEQNLDKTVGEVKEELRDKMKQNNQGASWKKKARSAFGIFITASIVAGQIIPGFIAPLIIGGSTMVAVGAIYEFRRRDRNVKIDNVFGKGNSNFEEQVESQEQIDKKTQQTNIYQLLEKLGFETGGGVDYNPEALSYAVAKLYKEFKGFNKLEQRSKDIGQEKTEQYALVLANSLDRKSDKEGWRRILQENYQKRAEKLDKEQSNGGGVVAEVAYTALSFFPMADAALAMFGLASVAANQANQGEDHRYDLKLEKKNMESNKVNSLEFAQAGNGRLATFGARHQEEIPVRKVRDSRTVQHRL